MSLLLQAIERRATAQADLDALLATAEAESREFTPDEDTAFRGHVDNLKILDARIAELKDIESRSDAAKEEAKKYASTTVTEPEIYTRDNGSSWFKDQFLARDNGNARHAEALDRIQKNDKHVRALSTTAGAGGEFAPPLWLIDEFAALARPGRPFADVVNKQPLPMGVSQIDLPRVSGGTTVAVQSTQNTAVSNTDMTTASVAAPVVTLAGYEVISQQTLDQTPIAFDQVVLADLAAAYGAGIDSYVITNTVSTIQGQTYTDASPTSAKVYSQIGQAIATVHSQRYLPPTHIVMSPVRWAHFLTETDSNGRPLVLPSAAYGAYNAQGTSDPTISQGIAGTLMGLPVLVDPNIPTNLGTGNNQDEILIVRAPDLWLYESSPRLDVLPQTYGNQLSVLIRLYNYAAFTAGRYPKSGVAITGTGMVAPAYGA